MDIAIFNRQIYSKNNFPFDLWERKKEDRKDLWCFSKKPFLSNQNHPFCSVRVWSTPSGGSDSSRTLYCKSGNKTEADVRYDTCGISAEGKRELKNNWFWHQSSVTKHFIVRTLGAKEPAWKVFEHITSRVLISCLYEPWHILWSKS